MSTAWAFLAIARVTDIDHGTIINWVKEKGEKLPDDPQDEEIPEITEIDELYAKRYPLGQTFVGCKKNKFWIWTVVNHWNQGILLWAVGDRSPLTFEQLWQIIKCWHSFWYVTRTVVYQDSKSFFANTFATDGIKTLIREVFSRLTGKSSGSPVIRLETSFGGGKTHDEIALWHICKQGREIEGVRFVEAAKL